MKKITSAIKEALSAFVKDITFEKVVVRLVMAWLLTLIFFFLKTEIAFNSAKFAAEINIAMFVCYIALFFIAFCALGQFKFFTWIEIYGPMILVTWYAYLTMNSFSDISYMIGIGLCLALSIVHAVNKIRVFANIRKKGVVIAIYAVAALVFMGYVGAIAILRYKTYSSPNYDFGIWSQMFYYMKTTFKPLTTCERDLEGLLSHFAVHFSPIYYIYLPIYYLFPSPITLNVLQVVTLAVGIIPIYRLCKIKGLSHGATAVFGVMFVLFPSLACGTYYDLHENCFLVPFLLWLFYYIEKDDMKGIVIFTVLTLLIKEDAALYTACIGLFMMMGRKKVLRGSVVTLISVLYFGIVTFFMSRYGLGIMDNRFSNYMVDAKSGGLIDVIRNFIVNPAYVVTECFSKDRLEFLLLMFLPVGFLPLASKKVSNIILFLPIIIMNLASDYVYQHSIFFQYTFGTLAILFYLAICNYSELSDRARRTMCSVGICSAIALLPITTMSKSYYFDKYNDNKITYAVLDDAMDSIPKDASVTASTFLLPHLADRDELYQYPSVNVSDYIVLDLRYKIDEQEIEDLKTAGYVETNRVNNLYVILKMKTLK